MSRNAAAGLALVLLSAACGSTVDVASQANLPGGTGGLSGGSALEGGGTSATTGGVGTTGSGTTGSSSVPLGGTGTGAPMGSTTGGTSTTGSTGVVDAVNGVGVTATTISFGFPYSVNGGAANEAAGGAGISTGDEKRAAEILRDEINAHGGIAGRKLVVVFHEVDALTTQTGDQIQAAACADLTEDHKVFGALAGSAQLLQCLDKAGSVTVLDNLAVNDEDVFRHYRYHAEVSLFNLDRLARAEVSALVAQKWFTPWDATLGAPGSGDTKVGVVTFDDPSFRRATTRSLLPALARAGHPAAPEDVVYVHNATSNAELSTTSGDISAAVLKLQSSGVEHIVLYDGGGTITLLFATRAESQHYRPRYGLNSNNAMGLLIDGDNVRPEQAVGSAGLGWFPALDLADADNRDDGPYSNAARRSCLKLMTSHGMTFADPNAKAVPLLYCNSFFFFKKAIEAGVQLTGSSAVTRDVYLAGVNAMGSSFESSMTFATSFSAAKHDGAAAYRHVAYNAGCQCMRYASALYPSR